MYSGWTTPFTTERPLHGSERTSALPRLRIGSTLPFAYSSVIHFNSTYVDFIDRRFRLRGMVVTTFGAILMAGMVLLGLFLVAYTNVKLSGEGHFVSNMIFSVIIAAMCGGVPVLLWRKHFRKELFTYTHYPVRFNRKTRHVHVFRHNQPGGVLTIPFDDVFWHVGRGMQQPFLCDVRGHVLDGTTVKDTFAVGHYFDDSRIDRIQSIWEFIRRYMDDGPDAVADHPLDRIVHLSTTPTWTNCYRWVVMSTGDGMRALRFVLFPVVFPVYGLLTVGRWLTLNSCKEPQWPAEIEAACRVAPGDPHRWQEPRFIGEFADRDGVAERDLERQRQRGPS